MAWQNAELQDAKGPYEAGLITLNYLIKEWNFVDENDKAVEVSQKALGHLPSKDMTFLITEATKLILASQSKKKVNSKKLLNLSSQKK